MMKPQIVVLPSFLLFLVFNIFAQGKTYTVQDTAVAARLLQESFELNGKGKYNSAYAKADSALVIFEQILGKESKEVAQALINKGSSELNKGKINEALSIFENALAILKKKFGDMHKELKDIYNSIGNAYYHKAEYDKALAYYEKTLTIRLKAYGTEHPEIASSFYNLGIIYQIKGDYNLSCDYYTKALDIRKKTLKPNDPDIAFAYIGVGACFEDNGEFDKAIEYYQAAIEIQLIVYSQDHPYLSKSYINLGNTYAKKGEYKLAIELYEKSLAINFKINPNSPSIVNSYYNIGMTYYYAGEYDKSIECIDKALRLQSKTSNKPTIQLAGMYNALGISYDAKGEYNKAFQYLSKAISSYIAASASNHSHIAWSYSNMSFTLNSLGKYDKSLEYKQKSLDIRIKSFGPNHIEVGNSYIGFSAAYSLKKNYNKAIEYYNKALEIYLASLGKEHPELAAIYSGIATSYFFKQEYVKAKEFNEKAASILLNKFGENHIHIAKIYNNIGSISYEERDYDNAIKYFQKALNIHINNFGSNHPEISEIYRNIALINTKNKQYNQSEIMYYKALNTLKFSSIDGLDKVNSLPELIKTLSAKADFERFQYIKDPNNSLNLYQSTRTSQQAIDVINYQNKVLDTEGSKAQLRDETYPIYEGAIKTKRLLYDLDKNDTLLHTAFSYAEQSKAKLLQAQIKASDALKYANIPDSLLQKEYNLRVDITWRTKQQQEKMNTGKSETDSSVLVISSKLFDLRQQYDSLKVLLEKNYPEYYRLKYDLNTVNVQDVQQKLLAPDQTLLEYMVGDSSIFIFTINQKDFNLVEVKKDFPLDSLVRVMREGIVGYHTAKVKTDSLRKAAPVAYTEGASLLYQKLVEPVKNQLKQHVIIIPDGILGYIPFEALIAKKSDKGRFKEHQYLLDSHRISYCYSATLLKEMIEKKHKKEPPYYLLAMAPYSTNDTTTIVEDLFVDTRKDLKPLRSSGQEVVNITTLMQGNPYYGKTATESTFTKLAPNYRLIHLATHGEANDQSGNYSFLAFSEIKDSIENELLYVNELYNLSLNADMVVLSACETGIGQLQRGEGIVSLARAFSYAGAKSIVTTLWQVDDEKTKRLMIDFYKHLHKGLSKDDALWQAKRDFIKKTESDPYFWAGFIGIGDMGSIKK